MEWQLRGNVIIRKTQRAIQAGDCHPPGKAVERNVGRKVEMNRASKQVDVGRLKRIVRVGDGNLSLQWEIAGGAGHQGLL